MNREVIHYNLQMIIAVGFKVNNDCAVRFRKWAGQIVKDYTIQGWTMDKERLKKAYVPMNILNVSWKIFVRYAYLSASFIKRLQISMPQRLITTKMPRLPGSFTKWYRIRCIGPYTGIQKQN